MTTARLRPSAVGHVGALLLAAALTLAGCSATNPVTTSRPYAASDGVDATLGSLSFGNLLVLAAAKDAPGTLIGSVTNTSDREATLQIGLAGDQTTVPVPGNVTVILGPEATAVDLGAVPAPPGALAEVVVSSDADGSLTVRAPVLDGTLEQYATLVPTP